MKLLNVISYGHALLQQALKNGDLAIDATMGNGHDTVFLAQIVGSEGHVYAFDIQQQALKNTETALTSSSCHNQVTLIHDSHHRLPHYIKDNVEINGAIFNLGYLPGGDKSVVTEPSTTIQALQWLIDHLAIDGVIVLVVYPGHPEGQVESESVVDYLANIDQRKFQVLRYEFINRKNKPPFLIAISRI